MPHAGPSMRVAALRGGVILVLLFGLMGILPIEKVADLPLGWNNALIFPYYERSAKLGAKFFLK